MGTTLKPIPFFSDQIKIDVHTATHAQHIKAISIAQFAGVQTVSLYQVEENGEYYAKRQDGAFIQGQEI